MSLRESVLPTSEVSARGRRAVPAGPSLLASSVLRRQALVSREVLGGLALLFVVGAFTVAPVLYVVINSFNAAPPAHPFAFTLDGWRAALGNQRTLGAIGYSLLLAIRIPIAMVFAFLIAWLLVRTQVPGRSFFEHLFWFAFFLPPLPIAVGWILLADPSYGLLNELLKQIPFIGRPLLSIYSVPGILWVHLTLSTIPVMVILLTPALRRIDATYEEAASTAGATTWVTLRKVTLPLIAPAMITAFLAGLIKSLEVFEIEQLLGTPVGIYVYSTRVYDLLRWEPPQYAEAMALSTLFLGFLLLTAIVYMRLLRRFEGQATLHGKSVRLQPLRAGRWSYVAVAALTVYVLFGLVLPLIVLVLGSLTRLFGFFFINNPWTLANWEYVFADPAFAAALRNSLVIGLTTAFVGTFLYALVAWVMVRTRAVGKGLLGLLAWLPWAVPGLLLGVGFLSILLNLPLASNLYGTLAPLVIVLIVQSLPLGMLMLSTSVRQISKELEEGAAMSGAGVVQTLRRVTFPLIAPMLAAVALVVFATTLRDISSLVLLSTRGTTTLSLLMFEFASAGRFESASVIGILIALVSMATTLVVLKLGLRLSI